MLRAPAARGARNKGCYFWTPLYVRNVGLFYKNLDSTTLFHFPYIRDINGNLRHPAHRIFSGSTRRKNLRDSIIRNPGHVSVRASAGNWKKLIFQERVFSAIKSPSSNKLHPGVTVFHLHGDPTVRIIPPGFNRRGQETPSVFCGHFVISTRFWYRNLAPTYTRIL
jgi:hypothetical protein